MKQESVEIINNNEIEDDIEKKLGDLFLRGWIMIPDSCPIERCNCPLMKNSNNQIYCINCESWIIEREVSRKKQIFGELVKLEQDKQKIKLKGQENPTQISNSYNKNFFTFEKHIVTCLQMKLVYLTNLLNNESDIYKIEKYLELIRSCIENIKTSKKL